MRIKITSIFETDRDPLLKGKTIKEINKMLVDEILSDSAVVSSRAEIEEAAQTKSADGKERK